MQTVKNWFSVFLRARGLERVNGQMLFRYRTTYAEYLELKQIFCARFKTLAGSPWRYESKEESALFVLYASEWWRREYAGGAWRWTSIFESLTTGTYRVDPLERSAIVEIGLSAWGHRPSEDGKKYLGAIVAHGGLPLKLLARGDGTISRLLISATRKAQILDWAEHQLVGFFESHSDDFVQHVRAPEIYKLLSDIVQTVRSLRSEYKLAGVSNPVAVLDQAEPKWRDRFPITVEDDSVDSLLIGLVREVSRQVKITTTYPVSVLRTLVKLPESDSYNLSLSLNTASTIALDVLASVMQVAPSKIPQSFVLEVVGDKRIQIGQARQLLGLNSSTVLIAGQSRRFFGKQACQEILIALRGIGADVVSPISIPGGELLDNDQPWVFEENAGIISFIGVGSCRVAGESAFILIPEDFKILPTEERYVELVGVVEDIEEVRWLYKITGDVSITVNDDIYTVRVNAFNRIAADKLIWKGRRCWYYSSPYPVYQGVPKLYFLDEDGQSIPVAEKDIEWTEAVRKGQRLTSVKACRGPVDAWWIVDGKRQRRFRMVLVAPDAHIAFESGASEHEGEIIFYGWGLSALHTTKELSSTSAVNGVATKLVMKVDSQPPANVIVTAEWTTALPTVRIELPFPATGGRFTLSNGIALQNATSMTLKRAHDVHVQVFDQNPNALISYRLVLSMSGEGRNNKFYHIEIPIPVDSNGVGDLRFFEIESTLNDLFCQSDHLDAYLDVNLIRGSVIIKNLRINRYDTELIKDQQSVRLLESQLVSITTDQLRQIRMLAIPLLLKTATPQVLQQVEVDGSLAGRWNLADLPIGNSPWLIYPDNESPIMIRPMIWSISAFDRLGTLQAMDVQTCVLAQAMGSSVPEDRARELGKVITQMSSNLEHPSWNLVEHHYTNLKHLPLSTLDYWRMIGRNQDACLAAVLKFPHDLNALMLRMRDELGVLWELTSRSSLLNAYELISRSLIKQFDDDFAAGFVRQMVDSLFSKMGFISESFATQIDTVLYEKSAIRSERFDHMFAKIFRSPIAILDEFWHGEDSYLQRVLLRNHANDGIWPYFKLTENIIGEMEDNCEPIYISYLNNFSRHLLWNPSAAGTSLNLKRDVANVPLLLGFYTQTCNANNWLQAEDRMVALRRIKAFDPIWFDLGVQTGALLAMQATHQGSQSLQSRTK